MNAKYPHIVRTPGICGGQPRLAHLRVRVNDVIGLLQNGETIESMPSCLIGVTIEDVHECLAFYEDHKAEIDELVKVQMTDPNESETPNG